MNAHHPSPDSQRIWLTGASSGIGLALAEELLAAGHRLALSARRSGPLQQLSERFPGQVLLVPGDLGIKCNLRSPRRLQVDTAFSDRNFASVLQFGQKCPISTWIASERRQPVMPPNT